MHDNILGISRQIMALKPLIKDIITKNAEPTPNILNLWRKDLFKVAKP